MGDNLVGLADLVELRQVRGDSHVLRSVEDEREERGKAEEGEGKKKMMMMKTKMKRRRRR